MWDFIVSRFSRSNELPHRMIIFNLERQFGSNWTFSVFKAANFWGQILTYLSENDFALQYQIRRTMIFFSFFLYYKKPHKNVSNFWKLLPKLSYKVSKNPLRGLIGCKNLFHFIWPTIKFHKHQHANKDESIRLE